MVAQSRPLTMPSNVTSPASQAADILVRPDVVWLLWLAAIAKSRPSTLPLRSRSPMKVYFTSTELGCVGVTPSKALVVWLLFHQVVVIGTSAMRLGDKA